MESQKKINYTTLTLTTIIVILFFLGFYNNENSSKLVPFIRHPLFICWC